MPDSAALKTATHPAPWPHLFVELGETAEKVHSKLDKVAGLPAKLKVIAGSEAFRRYNWLKNVPIANAKGNFRGMVMSKRWKAVYSFSNNLAEKVERYDNYLAAAAIIIELSKEAEKIEKIWSSDEPAAVKARKYSIIGSMAIFRAVTGVVPAGAHALAKSLEGYCWIANVVSASDTPRQWINNIRAADAKVSSTYNNIYSADSVEHFINHYLIY